MKTGVRYSIAASFLALTLVGCGSSDAPIDVSLRTLVDRQSEYEGRMVMTRGLVRTFDTPRHYWIEDDDLNRVGLVPEATIAPYLGETVQVIGRFAFVEGAGRQITIDRIESFP